MADWQRAGKIGASVGVLPLLLLSGCMELMMIGKEGPPPLTAEQRDHPFFKKPFLLGAHRGGGSLWPENTLVAFREAGRRWPEVVLETDARLTADGQVVLMHDARVDRTTDGKGEVTSLTLAEIKKLDAGYRFTPDEGQTYPYRGKGVRVATLAEALAAMPESRFEVEFKRHGGEGIVAATIAVIQAAGAQDRVLAASFDPEHMIEARKLEPRLATCYEFVGGQKMLKALRGKKWAAYRPTAHCLSMMRRMYRQFDLTPEEIRKIREKGIYFQIHTVNKRSEMDWWLDLGVDSILSDRPDLLAEAIAGRKSGRKSGVRRPESGGPDL